MAWKIIGGSHGSEPKKIESAGDVIIDQLLIVTKGVHADKFFPLCFAGLFCPGADVSNKEFSPVPGVGNNAVEIDGWISVFLFPDCRVIISNYKNAYDLVIDYYFPLTVFPLKSN